MRQYVDADRLNENGVTIIIVTHDFAVADMCKKQISIVDGTINYT